MLPLYQAEELTRRRSNSALTNMQLAQDWKGSIRRGRTRDALERIAEVNTHNGANLGGLTHEMIAVLHRVAE